MMNGIAIRNGGEQISALDWHCSEKDTETQTISLTILSASRQGGNNSISSKPAKYFYFQAEGATNFIVFFFSGQNKQLNSFLFRTAETTAGTMM
jgi:hypothetical protein